MLRRAFVAAWGDLYRCPTIFDDYITHDPGFRPDNLRGLFLRRKLVSAYQAFPRRIVLGKQRYHLVGIGNVCTDLAYQGKGYGSALMRWFVENYDIPKDLAILYTGRYEFYARLGWQRLHYRTLHVRRPTGIERVVSHSDMSVQPLLAKHLDRVRRIYSMFNEGFALPHILRSKAYWQRWILDWKLKIYRLTAEVISTPDGRVSGYVFHSRHAGRGVVEEYGADPEYLTPVHRAILRRVLLPNDQHEMVFSVAIPPLETFLKVNKVPHEAVVCREGMGYAFRPELRSFLEHSDVFMWHVDHC